MNPEQPQSRVNWWPAWAIAIFANAFEIQWQRLGLMIISCAIVVYGRLMEIQDVKDEIRRKQ